MRRREFIAGIGTLATSPFVARAQQPAMPVVGYLNSEGPSLFPARAQSFLKGLSETGYVEGRNVQVEYRWAEDRYDRLPEMAADLVRRQVNVIAANYPAVFPAKAASATIPIVFSIASDPVEAGLVASMNRPGGNLTGITMMGGTQTGPKRVQLLHELVPATTAFALLINPTNPNTESLLKAHQDAADAVGLQMHVIKASTEPDLERLDGALDQLQLSSLVIGADPFFTSHMERLATMSIRHRVASIYQNREFAAFGGLASYGGSVTDTYHQAGIYVGRLLKGERPSDLPVQQSTKIELIINLNTAKSLGLAISLPLLGRADEVIE
jgi:putative tryptophan/tyrosine transport system substrate-binding protein